MQVSCLRLTVQNVVEAGRELLKVKGKLAHGSFLPWVDTEFPLGRSSAYRFMNVASASATNFPQWKICPWLVSMPSLKHPTKF